MNKLIVILSLAMVTTLSSCGLERQLASSNSQSKTEKTSKKSSTSSKDKNDSKKK